jgi:hypothetical protein
VRSEHDRPPEAYHADSAAYSKSQAREAVTLSMDDGVKHTRFLIDRDFVNRFGQGLVLGVDRDKTFIELGARSWARIFSAGLFAAVRTAATRGKFLNLLPDEVKAVSILFQPPIQRLL